MLSRRKLLVGLGAVRGIVMDVVTPREVLSGLVYIVHPSIWRDLLESHNRLARK